MSSATRPPSRRPLASEIAFVQKYVEIEQARFGDRLSVSYGLGDDLRGALVPQLIVQPLVENALKHGLAPRAAAGHLAIGARRLGASLELTVADDGIGLALAGTRRTASGWPTCGRACTACTVTMPGSRSRPGPRAACGRP